jgi:hypothetical protein
VLQIIGSTDRLPACMGMYLAKRATRCFHRVCIQLLLSARRHATGMKCERLRAL